MENGPCEDVFPIKHGHIPASYVSLPEGKSNYKRGDASLNSSSQVFLYFDCWEG